MRYAEVAIIIPYKKELGHPSWWLTACIDSIAGQTSLAWRIYVADRGAVAEAVQAQYEASAEPLVMILPSNDTIAPDFIETATTALDSAEWADYWVPNGAVLSAEILNNSIMCGIFVLRREFVQARLGGRYYIQSPDGEVGMEDWHLWMRLWKAGAQGVTDDRTLFFWRQHADSTSARIIGTPLFERKLRWMRETN